MARIEMATQGWGLFLDGTGNGLPGQTVTLKDAGTANASTHWSAITGGTSSTAAMTTSATGTLTRFIEEGSYDLTIGATTYRVEAATGATLGLVASAVVYLTSHGGVADGVADNATPLTNAVAALPSSGGTIVLPRGVVNYSAHPVLDGKISVRFVGQGGLSGGAAPGTRLVFTGTGSGAAISARSTTGVEFHGIQFNHTSASFTGTMLDLSATGTKGSASGRGADTQLPVINGCRFDGLRTVAVMVDLDNAIIVKFRDTVISGGLIGVRGHAAAPTYSKKVGFDNVTFLGNVTVHVQSPEQNWNFNDCTFEQLYTVGGASAGAGAINHNGLTGIGLTVKGCYFGDATATGTWIGPIVGSSIVIDGNTFGDAAKGIETGSSVYGLVIKGNQFNDTTTAIVLGTNPLGTVIEGNDFVDGGITAAATVQGLVVMGNKFQAGVAPLTFDGTAAKGIVFFGNDVVSAASGFTVSAGTLPNTSILQDANGQLTISTLKTAAGAVSDASFPATPRDGTLALDTTNFKIYVRFGGAWKSVTLA